jgi:retron-type reverse transcriptase
MTPGSDPKKVTLDGIDRKFFVSIADKIRTGQYTFKPVRIKEIPKANGKIRPLGISDPREKIVQKAIELILSSI